MRRSSSLSANTEEARKHAPKPPDSATLSTPTSSGTIEKESSRKSLFLQSTVSASRKTSSLSLESTASCTIKKTTLKLSLPSTQLPPVKSVSKNGTQIFSHSTRSPLTSSKLRKDSSSAPLDRRLNLSARKMPATPESRDSCFVILPQVEMKAVDDVVISPFSE
ncbi:hypothetical protein Dimus_031603, partial [Dionaea muscipula]